MSKSAADAATSAAGTASETLKEMRTGSGAQDTHTLAQQAVTQAKQTANLAEAAKTSASTAAANLTEFKRTERASVSVRNIEVIAGEPIVNGKPSTFNFYLNLDNSGSTSTKHLTIQMVAVSHEMFGNPIDVAKAMKFKASIPAVMGPRSTLRLFTSEAVSEYVYKVANIQIGRMTYGDVFGTEHITEYCWEFVGLPTADHPTMQPCTYPGDSSHNCQDEDCKVN